MGNGDGRRDGVLSGWRRRQRAAVLRLRDCSAGLLLEAVLPGVHHGPESRLSVMRRG